MRIREASVTDAPAIARVTVDTWKTAYRGIIDDNYSFLKPGEQTASELIDTVFDEFIAADYTSAGKAASPFFGVLLPFTQS